MQKISVVIITYNEEKNIRRCLESVQGVADEIVVVDSFSNDQTQSICEEYQVKFLKHAFEGHIQQKNWAAQQAEHQYVLSLDADEALSSRLKQQILRLKEEGFKYDGYYMNRLTSFCGKWMKHTWYPDRKLRLWNKEKGQWGGENPHDSFYLFDNTLTKRLKGDLLHYSYYTVSEFIQQIDKFTTIAAKENYAKGIRVGKCSIYVHTFSNAFKMIFLKGCFLDGFEGVSVLFGTTYSVFLKYSKIYYLEKRGEV